MISRFFRLLCLYLKNLCKNIKNLLANHRFNHVPKFLNSPRLCFTIDIELIFALEGSRKRQHLRKHRANFAITTKTNIIFHLFM